MNTAISHHGEHGDWVWANAPQQRGNPWCAAFVWTCAKVAGVQETLIPNTYSARYMGKLTAEKLGGQKVISPAYGGPSSFVPRRGDLIFFRWTFDRGQEWWVANHVGIVVNTSGDTVTTIEGNKGGKGNWGNTVSYRQCSKSYNKICYYVRPAWTAADYGGSDGGTLPPDVDNPTPWEDTSPVINNPLWADIEPNTRNDMMIREVGYINSGGLSVHSSSLPVSVANYTTGISALLSACGVVPSYSASGDYCTDALRPVARAVAQQLVANGFTMAAAIGILGNMQRESNLQPEVINPNGGASGLCQWFGGRCTAMKQFVGANWATNVTGQVNFLLHEVTNVTFFRKQLYDFLRNCPNSLEGARTAADTFFHWYEALGTYTESESMRRIVFATEMWNKLTPIASPDPGPIVSPTPGVNGGTLLEEFISYLHEQVNNHSIYVWGAQGQRGSEITQAWIRSRESDDTHYNNAIKFWKAQCAAGYGQILRAFDCSGLGMYWLQNVKGILKWDHSADNLYHACAKIQKSQLQPGDFVFRCNSTGKAVHIGYIVDYNRTVIEAKGRSYGVIRHTLQDNSWNAYGRPPYWTR